MSITLHYYTRKGFEKAQKALQVLQTKERLQISQEIEEARSKGDLSENAEYHAAKEAQEHLENKIASLKEKIAHSRIIDEDKIDRTQVSILASVKLQNSANGMVLNYTLVPPSEAHFKGGKISTSSPIGKGLLGKKIGDCVDIQVPAGKITLKVLEITYKVD